MQHMGWGGFAGAVMAMAALVACAPAQDGSPYAPTGEKKFARTVDPLIVGHRLMAAGEYEAALDAYIRAGADQGPTVEVLSSIGTAEISLGRLNQAEQTLRRATEVDGTFVPAWNNLGVALMEQRKYAEAALVFEVAFKIDGGQTAAIAENLRLALAKSKNSNYGSEPETNYKLLPRGSGEYLLVAS